MEQKAVELQHGNKRKVEDSVNDGPRKKKVKAFLNLSSLCITVKEKSATIISARTS